MITCCSHCGADLSHRPVSALFGQWEAGCPDCGLAAEEEVAVLAPGGDEVEYGLAEWAPRDRILLRNALAERGVPWRWEPGPVLVVDERDQSVVEAVLDDLEADEGEAASEDEDDEEGDGESDAIAQEAMADLFVIADRLLHTPANGQLVIEADRLASVAEQTPPPFGVGREVWEGMIRLSRALVDAGERADEEDVEEAARGLRDYLRDYV